jgi:[acyl-carrier-protein] S-malonyltransferase
LQIQLQIFYKNTEEIQNELYNQTFGPVKWVETIQKLKELGVETIYEIGPGKVLSGLIKKIDSDINLVSIENVNNINEI